MVEKDLRIIQKEFRDIVGFTATAGISDAGAKRSAGIIVDLEDKILGKNTQAIDLFRATLATSQLIERWSQIRQSLVAGSISSVEDAETLELLHAKFSGGNLAKAEIMRLTKIAYVANPAWGANKAMEVLDKLRTIYADISLHQPKS